MGEETSAPPLQHEDLAAVERLKAAFAGLKAEMSKVIVGQQNVLEELLIAIFARGHCLLIGVPGLAKTLMIHTLADALNLTYNRIQFTPDLMPSDITGTEVILEEPERPAVRASSSFVPGPDLRQHPPGRRDQPDPAQDPGRAPPGDAGARGSPSAASETPAPARPVLRPGHAEPDRAGGDVSPARSPARPVHAQHHRRLPERGRGVRHRPADDVDDEAERDQGPLGRRHPGAPGDRPEGPDRRPRRPVCRPAGAVDPQGPGRRARVRPRLRELGRGPPGEPVPGAGGQGPGGALRPLLRLDRGHPGRGRAGPPPPDRHQFQRRGRGAQARRHRRRLVKHVPVDDREAEQSGKLPKIFKSANAG